VLGDRPVDVRLSRVGHGHEHDVRGGHGLGVACGVAAIVGHILPATRRFRGGKGVATAMGMITVLYPLGALVGILCFAAACALTRIAAVGSLVGTLTGVLTVAVIGAPALELVALFLCVGLIWFRHLDNIQRLFRGQEGTTHLRSPG
jgi:acyl phosphate:glycerol-3-phosphate acyltransferase